MITSFEVGALFRLVDEISTPLRKIREAVRELNEAITLARDNLKGLGATPGLAAAIAETDSLAAAWRKVGESSAAAAKVVASSAASSARSAAATAAGMAHPRGPNAHLTGPSASLPGGSHIQARGNAAMVAAAAVGYGIYEDAELQKDIHWVNYHLGRGDTKENVAEVRKIIEDAMVSTGMPMRDVAKAATEEARLMKGTPGESSGIAALPDFLRAAASEAMAKDTTVQESMKAIIGLAHMVKAYTPEAIHKLLPAFAYLSTANPAGLKEMEKSFSYAVPILQSGADVDPITTMLLGTALSTAGVTSSKSGTWLREFAVRAMPGDAKHNKMLNRFGLLDDNDKPTWFTNGRPDPTKALEIAGPIAAQMPPEERLPAEMDLFGRRGGGAFAVLGDAKVLGRIAALRKEMESEGFKNRYATILEDYKGTAVGTARTTLAEFNVTMMRLGDTVLPAVTGALRDFSSVLQGIRALIPGQGAAKIGTRGIEFATAGGILGGIFGGPIGLIGGAMFGGAVGLTEGSMENDAKGKWTSPGKTGHPAKQMNFLQGPPIELKPRPISLSLNVDGRTLAQSISDQLEYLYEHATGAPSYDGQRRYNTADGQMTGA